MSKKFDLDLKDRKILAVLDFSSRLPISELARRVGLSKQSVDYRINSLIRRGVIDGFFPVINTPKLGFIYCRIFIQFKSLDLEQEKSLKKYIFDSKKLFWAFSLGGTYDFLLDYWVESLSEFEEIIVDFLHKFGGLIENHDENIITRVVNLNHKFFVSNTKAQRFDLQETTGLAEVDIIDRDILKALAVNARSSLVEISSSTKIPSKVVAYRIKRMEEKELILGYRPVINYEKLGLTYFKVFLNLDFSSKEKVLELEKFLINHQKVIFIVHGLSMPGNLDIELIAESNSDFFAFVKELKNKFPKTIKDYSYLIYTQTLKVNFVPFE